MELLICTVNHTHTDPIKDQRGSYKRGDILEIGPAGNVWGRKQIGMNHPLSALYQEGGIHDNGTPPTSTVWILRVLRDDTFPVWDTTSGREPTQHLLEYREVERNPALVGASRRRGWQVLLNDLPSAVRRSLNDTGYAEIPWLELRGHMQNKNTTLRESTVREQDLALVR